MESEEKKEVDGNEIKKPVLPVTKEGIKPIESKEEIETPSELNPIIKKDDSVKETSEKKELEEEVSKKIIEEEQIEIDGVTYTLDKDGNATLDGEVKFTKESIEELSGPGGEGDQSDIIAKISELSGIQIIGEDGNPILFEDTYEGLAQREQAIKEIGIKEGFEKGFNEYLNANPDVASIIEYKQRFGTIEGYTQNVDYSKVEIGEEIDSQVDLIYKAKIQQGSTPESAKRYIEFCKTNNSVKEEAEDSLEYLRKNQESEISIRRAKQQEEERIAYEQDVKYYGITYDEKGNLLDANVPGSLYDSIVKKSELKGYKIPLQGINIKTDKGVKKMSREELFDYLWKPVVNQDGMYLSQGQLDEMNRMADPQEYALRAIQNLTGGMEGLVKATIAEEKVKEIRRLSTSNKKSTKEVSTYTPSKNSKDKIKLPITINNK